MRVRVPLAIGVAALAFTARLVPVLRGGGLFGLGDYDDGVHYAAAVGLVHGRLPYRDFLFLHPPGIVLALVPFAALGRLCGDPLGFAAARVGWMVLGALNALLVMRILRRQPLLPALLAGVFYALFPPAVYGEHTTQLEGIATTCLLIALLLLQSPWSDRWRWAAVAGAALGVSTSIKIWGAAAVLIVAAWAMKTGGLRRLGAILTGAVASASLICLPFFIVAPGPMSRMVVRDQLGRPAVHTDLAVRMEQIAGLSGHPAAFTPTLVLVLAAFTVVVCFASLTQEARLAVMLVVGLTVLLAVTPSWFVHYASLIAGPAAVTVGFGTAQLIERAARPRFAIAAAVVLGLAVSTYAIPATAARFGERFPGEKLNAVVANTPGCVTADNPTTLVEMNVLGRNLDRGCRLVVDLGGESYDHPTTPPVARAKNHAWQRYALGYLATGSLVIITRFSTGSGFSRATAASVQRWRVIQRIGRFTIRRATT